MQNTSNNQDFSHIIFSRLIPQRDREYFYRFCLVAALLQVTYISRLASGSPFSILYRYSARAAITAFVILNLSHEDTVIIYLSYICYKLL